MKLNKRIKNICNWLIQNRWLVYLIFGIIFLLLLIHEKNILRAVIFGDLEVFLISAGFSQFIISNYFSLSKDITELSKKQSKETCFYKIIRKINDFNKFDFSLIIFSIVWLIPFIIEIRTIIPSFITSPAKVTSDLLICFTAVLPVWTIFFNYCHKIIKMNMSYEDKLSPIFWTTMIRTILVAIVGFIVIIANTVVNLSNCNYTGTDLMDSNDFEKDLVLAISYFIGCTAALYYPILDMFEYTRKTLDQIKENSLKQPIKYIETSIKASQQNRKSK